MATKTVVCRECGAPAAPGRFACVDCGALLASVGPAPVRRRRAGAHRTSRSDDGQTGQGDAPARVPPETVDAGPTPSPAATASAADGVPAQPASAARGPAPAAGAITGGGPPVPASPPAPALAPPQPGPVAIDLDESDEREIDEDAPLAAAIAEPEWPSTPVAPAWLSSRGLDEPDHDGPDVREPDPGERAAPEPGPTPWLDHRSSERLGSAEPSWPPVGAREPLEPPPPRTPAGAYLAPSAVLPPLEAPGARAGHPAAAASAAASTDAKPQASLAETLDAFGVTADAPRRLIGGGAAIAALGFLLPWAEVVIGSGLAGSYWARWGMAGPGHWIVVTLLVALIVVALAKDRLARVPVGPIAIGLGMLLVGLVWPYLFGVIGHSVGVWLVLVGAIVLGIGGILDLRRHATASPDV